MSRFLKLLVVLLLSGGVLVACGGDDDDGGADAAADVDADADEGDDDVDIADFAASGDCGRVASAMAAATVGANAAFTGQGGDLEESAAQLDRLIESVPDEIQDDLALLAEAYGELVDALADVGYDPSSGQPPTAEQMEAMESMSERFDDSRFNDAADNVSAWLADECDVDANG